MGDRVLVQAREALAACLTERKECRFFERLRDEPAPEGLGITFGDTAACLIIETPRPLFLYSGFQIITRERLEVLALVCKSRVPDGESAADTIAAVTTAGGIPVLPWSPGKWLGQRGKVIKQLISTSSPDAFVMGDTAMRPIGTPEPALLRRARAQGHPILAGTDPLPFAGDTAVMGQYASRWEGLSMGTTLSTDTFRAMIMDTASESVGARNAVPRAMTRWLHNART